MLGLVVVVVVVVEEGILALGFFLEGTPRVNDFGLLFVGSWLVTIPSEEMDADPTKLGLMVYPFFCFFFGDAAGSCSCCESESFGDSHRLLLGHRIRECGLAFEGGVMILVGIMTT
jgi:hypothetical protein